MSALQTAIEGAFYEVGFAIRPLKVVTISNSEQEAFIGETSTFVQSMEDFVLQTDADRLKGIWIKSISEKHRVPFREIPAQASAEEQIQRAAAVASDKIDLALEHRRIAAMDMAVPGAFAVDLPTTDPVKRMECLETLVPFQRIRELLIKRERSMSMEPLGRIAFTARRIELAPGGTKLN